MNKKKVLNIEENKFTYDDLLHAKTINEIKKKDSFNKIMIIKYVAVTIILFAIIFGSLLLFRQI